MTKANCQEITRELDEMILGEDYDTRVSTHLRECPECSDFNDKQLKLRQIIGSLGTVSAPADFDFKLRARLANDSASSGFHMGRLFAFGQRSVAIATALVLLVGALVFVRYLLTTNANKQAVAKRENAPPSEQVKTPQPAPLPSRSQEAVVPAKKDNLAFGVAQYKDVPRKRTASSGTQRTKPPLATLEFSSEREGFDPVFPVDASQQPVTVSLFDKKGNPKTISLPAVSFGSQRVVPTATSYATKGVW